MGGSATETLILWFFTRFDHYFQLNLDETSFLCNEVDLKVVRGKDKPRHDKN